MKKLLNARLNKQANKFTQKFTASHRFDRRLYAEDLAVSTAHAKMLHKIGALTKGESTALINGLEKVKQRIQNGKLKWRDDLEDIHMHIEAQLISDLGEVGKKLHLGRSRNDQVATDLRLYLRKEIDEISKLMLDLCLELANKALVEHATLMPGFTHMQPAQPITCGHHMLAWYSMLLRDYGRLMDCRKRVNQMPLGSAALAGTSVKIDREITAKELEFDEIMDNSLDAVSSRDFIIEFNAVASIAMQHLSRWSEELIIWHTNQFSFVELDDQLCTGSSIMPQKKNPDLPELVRGKSGRVIGNLIAILVVMKGQALAYNKDNQEDKELLFDTVDSLKESLTAWILIVKGMEFKRDNMREALEFGYVNATRLADYLVDKGVPFRDAYKQTGMLVRKAEEKKIALGDLELEEMHKVSNKIDKDIYSILDYKNIIKSYDHLGGSAPNRVRKAATQAIKAIERKKF